MSDLDWMRSEVRRLENDISNKELLKDEAEAREDGRHADAAVSSCRTIGVVRRRTPRPWLSGPKDPRNCVAPEVAVYRVGSGSRPEPTSQFWREGFVLLMRSRRSCSSDFCCPDAR